MPPNKSTRKLKTNGYVVVKTNNGWEYEHRLVLAQALGRDLNTTEQVKWVDGNRSNNELSNLELWQLKRIYPTETEG